MKVQYARPGWLHWLYDSIGREAERPSYAWQIRFLAVVLILIGACLLPGTTLVTPLRAAKRPPNKPLEPAGMSPVRRTKPGSAGGSASSR